MSLRLASLTLLNIGNAKTSICCAFKCLVNWQTPPVGLVTTTKGLEKETGFTIFSYSIIVMPSRRQYFVKRFKNKGLTIFDLRFGG
jgi:hypothetical protein